jgi:hypothetical protein
MAGACLALYSAPSVPSASSAPSPAAASADPLGPYASASKRCRAALEKAQALAARGKWKSAFAALDEFDKSNADPYALAMKTNLALKGAASSAALKSFGFVDLEEGQDLEELRQEGAAVAEFPFDPPALADAQAARGIAAPGVLSKELGDYYYEAASRFSGKWPMSDEELLSLAIKEYSAADGRGAMDGESFLKYASSLAFRGRNAEALREVDASIAAFGEGEGRVDALALGAKTAARIGDSAKEAGYYAAAEKAFPNSPTPGILRLMVAVESGKGPAAEAAAEGLVAGYGSNPNVVRAIVSTWVAAGEGATARAFLEGRIASVKDEGALGALCFYLAALLAQGSPSDADRKAALAALDAAAAHLKASGGANADIYRIMDGIRESLAAPPSARPRD